MKFLLIALSLILFYPSISFSNLKSAPNSRKIFPTPKGFTTNYKEGFVIKLQIPSYIEKELTTEKYLGGFIRDPNFCETFSIKSITTKIGAVTYKLVSGVGYGYKKGVYKIWCSFRWSKYSSTAGTYTVVRESPSYYIKKR